MVDKVLLVLSLLTSQCNAFFRNMMIGELAAGRIDPIMAFGKASQHVHHLNGGSNLGLSATGTTMSTSNCTNSIVKEDKSGYWAPYLYFQHADGTIESVNLTLGLTAYYKYEVRPSAPPGVNYSVFPKGFQMIAGDSNKRNWIGPWPVPDMSHWGPDDLTQGALAEKSVGFNCLHYGQGNEDTFAFPWLRNRDVIDSCFDGVRAEILFPSCWDGKNLDSKNHRDHVAYPTNLQGGVCPDTHPVYLPILFYETIWNTPEFNGIPGEFVLAQGDPTGLGYHGDFVAAWDDGVQEKIVANTKCTGLSSSGQVEDCPVLTIQTQEEANMCKLQLPPSIASEKVQGIVPQGLPGGMKVIGVQHDPGTPDMEDIPGYIPAYAGFEHYVLVSEGSVSKSSGLAAQATLSSAIAATTWKASSASLSFPTTTLVALSPSITPTPSTVGFETSRTTITTAYVRDMQTIAMVLIEEIDITTITIAPTVTFTVVVNGTNTMTDTSTVPTSTAHGLLHVHRHRHKRGGHQHEYHL